MIRPVEIGSISQLWGGNPSYYQQAFGIPYHNGTDYASPQGTPITSISDGVVAYIGYDHSGYGHYIRVWHPHLLMCSFYAHMLASSQEVGAGSVPGLFSQVSEGSTLGYVGSTGNSTGPHLHFEMRLMLDARKYDISPYQGISRGRINPETVFRLMDRAVVMETEPHVHPVAEEDVELVEPKEPLVVVDDDGVHYVAEKDVEPAVTNRGGFHYINSEAAEDHA